MTAEASYRNGIKYAVEELQRVVPHIPLYLDAAHGGLLGIENSATMFVELIKVLL